MFHKILSNQKPVSKHVTAIKIKWDGPEKVIAVLFIAFNTCFVVFNFVMYNFHHVIFNLFVRPLCPQKNSTKHCLCRTCSRSRVFPCSESTWALWLTRTWIGLQVFGLHSICFRLGVSGVFWKTTFYPKLKGLYHQTVSSDINGLQNVDETSISPYHTDTTTILEPVLL